MHECKNCSGGFAQMCTCPELQSDNAVVREIYAASSFDTTKPVRWELAYTDLDRCEKRKLCRVGTCSKCGNQVCMGEALSENLRGNSLLLDIYRRFHSLWSNYPYITEDAIPFEMLFLGCFYDEDKSRVAAWLSDAKNYDVEQFSKVQVTTPASWMEAPLYTIICTSSEDSMNLEKPVTNLESYLTEYEAQNRMNELVCEYRKTLDRAIYDTEDRTKNMWQAYQADNYCEHFLQVEIANHPLRLGNGFFFANLWERTGVQIREDREVGNV